MTDTTSRPRLATHVAVRRYLRREGSEAVVSLHDEQAGRVACVGDREWAVLRAADGTRDVAGIVAAARREGHAVAAATVEAFLSQLEAAGMLAAGPSAPPAASPSAGRREAMAFPDFALRCDGRGTCCRIYPTIAMAPTEACRARGLNPDLVLTPERGSEDLPWQASTPTLVEGRCPLLDEAGRCTLHASGGLDHKPHGCGRFPHHFVDDGVSLRAAVAPECACVFVSDGAAAAPERVPLDPRDHVTRVPTTVALTADRAVDGAAYRRFAGALEQARAAAERAAEDPLGWLVEQARRLDDDARPLAHHAAVGELATALERCVATQGFRAEADFGLAVPRWMGAALARYTKAGSSQGEARPYDEWLFLRAWLFGHGPALAGAPIAFALRRAGLTVAIARALPACVEADHPLATDPALGWPLALVAAATRAWSLW
ncbi:MAG: YkgJ family cysteine cluster protein [Myxococcales bacterium]|nr:YkgJ family cysteine cluster protein [Myxococcales bacterium]